ncbi:uncharacterized protein HMPREF1541_10538 [Cyphellophora europaea CBS 101466]|uniref:Enoyl reductase (ER) domain-containing protein n=1 Tax=Cyphellophora europaea (strain CBS 101466) TaxID=1220924 RepID=W2S8K1_CYPE1|nr:uncharacterized protein HMPREF1541_10538 [Cyphellophora europaea CBS 101466]ETN44358.1 hypothetical protein HMPREF1541_10538 [Cyphellophora europaea CBS 101466]
MKEVLISVDASKKLITNIHDVPIPTPGPKQVVIRNVVVGTNPKDWKYARSFAPKPQNTGDDVAGYIHAVGSDVTEFHVGDRVAAFHEMRTPHGAFAEYTLAYANTTFPVPPATPLESAATIPLAAMTAAVGLYARLGLPEPWAKVHPARALASQGGVVVYGGASAVGAFAIKLLVRADVHPIIAVAGRGMDYVRGLLVPAKGDVVLDYRAGDEAVVAGIRGAVPKGGKLMYAFDAVSEKGSVGNICKVLDDKEGSITTVLPGREHPEIPEGVKQTLTTVGSAHGVPDDLSDLAFVWFRAFALGLREGWFEGHPYEVVPGGLGGVGQGLNNLREGKASAVKYVYRVEETEGLEKSRM